VGSCGFDQLPLRAAAVQSFVRQHHCPLLVSQAGLLFPHFGCGLANHITPEGRRRFVNIGMCMLTLLGGYWDGTAQPCLPFCFFASGAPLLSSPHDARLLERLDPSLLVQGDLSFV
jgi:hypothetical protein